MQSRQWSINRTNKYDLVSLILSSHNLTNILSIYIFPSPHIMECFVNIILQKINKTAVYDNVYKHSVLRRLC